MLKRDYVDIDHVFSHQQVRWYVKEYAKRRSMLELVTLVN